MKKTFFCPKYILICLFALGLLVTCNLLLEAANNSKAQTTALYARLDGSINPAQVDWLQNAIKSCEQNDYDLLLIGLDTPGGLGQSMREMVKIMLNSPVPVLVWVGPSGARAASAGVFLVAASATAGMSPQTTIGAASPVGMGGKKIPEEMAQKIKNDILSLIRGIAAAKDRNVDWYEKAVEESVSITASEAVMQKVVEFMAVDESDFLVQSGLRGISWKDDTLHFKADELKIVAYEPGFRHSLLAWLLDPQIAYFLLLGGMAGLFFELTNPGSIFPGVLGGICLLLGLYALSVLPTNAAGILLILFGVVLFILEIAVTSFGLLSVGGLVCLFFGSVILFNFEYGLTELSMQTIIGTVIGAGALILLGIYLITKAQLRPRQTGEDAMLGLTGEVISWAEGQGKVSVRGEIWSARTEDNQPLEPKAAVKVVKMQGLVCIVQPISETPS